MDLILLVTQKANKSFLRTRYTQQALNLALIYQESSTQVVPMILQLLSSVAIQTSVKSLKSVVVEEYHTTVAEILLKCQLTKLTQMAT